MATYWYLNDNDNNYYCSPDNDYVYGYGGNDSLHGGAGDDTVDGGAGSDALYGESGNDKLIGGAGNDMLNGGAGSDTMTGGAGNDVYYVESLGDVVVEAAGGGTSDIVYSYVNYTLSVNVERLVLLGTATNGTGSSLNNVLVGNPLNNILKGEGGNDTLNGFDGDDSLYGGSGDDELYGGNHVDSLVGDAGNDGLYGGDDNDFLDGGIGNDTLYGESGSDTLNGGIGNDTLDGGNGSDFMSGRAGNDIYYVDSLNDLVIESEWIPGSPGFLQDMGGIDTIVGSFTYTLGNFVENLTLSGTAVNGTGNDLANVITGNASGNTLTGNGGTDTLKGGLGDDFLHGNAGNDTLYGEGGNDDLFGEEGGDIMLGGAGGDVYRVRETTDKVYETTTITSTIDAGGNDTVESYVNYTLGNFVENLDLSFGHAIKGTGNIQANIMWGNDEANVLDGKAGQDEMRGGEGDDTYYADLQSDTIVEGINEGWDTVFSSASSYTLSANVEVLRLTGTAGISGTGNSGGNRLYGNSGNNILTGEGGDDILDGGAGNDTMSGGAGDDTYHVNAPGDVVIESPGGGLSDAVNSSISYSLVGNDIEHLFLIGSASINGTGNDLDNDLEGNSGNNILTGGAGDDILAGFTGSDTMFGGSGNDTYYVDSTGDKVYETTTATSTDDSTGNDKVYSTVSYTLGLYVEYLTLQGNANINGFGNGSINTLVGNAGNNILDGGLGNEQDTLIGNEGNDTYIIVRGTDTITEALNEGTDLVQTGQTYTLTANVENLTLTGLANVDGTGNTLDNVLTGNSGDNYLYGLDGNDILNGGVSDDILYGGNGDDTYYVIGDDMVVEGVGAGTDTVYVSSTLFPFYPLADNVENLIFTGSANLDGSGNILDNYLIGNTGKNTLEGGGGDDTLNGGAGIDYLIGDAGDDTYWVDNAGDVVIEGISQGSDKIYSTVSYALAAAGCHCEALQLNGTAAINATGNDLSNWLYGNAKNNILSGLGESDTLMGYAGNDTLKGGKGGDSLWGGNGNDTLTGGIGIDHFYFDTALSATSNKDTITDMVHLEDQIRLDDDIFIGLTGGNFLQDANFHSGNSNMAGDPNDYILYNTVTGALLYDADGSTAGGVAAVQFATLTGRPDITAADFYVIG